jgi:hypothetical protein
MRFRFLPCLRCVGFFGLLLAAGPAAAMSVIAPTFDELVKSADFVARGVVTDVHCITVDTPNGQAIKTLVTLRVERALKGTPGDQVTLAFLGGKVGRRTLRILGMPTFHPGDREIVFVSHNGRVICPLVAAGYGRYHVRHDAATNQDYVTRDNHEPLTSIAQIPQSLEQSAAPPAGTSPMTVERFEARITAAVAGSRSAVQP